MIAGPVLIAADEGPVLHAERHDVSADWVLFVHDVADPASDLEGLRSLFAAVRTRDFSLLAVDLRGHGQSEGSPASDAGEADLRTAFAYIRAAGARSVFLLAAGATAGTALGLAASLRPDGLLLLSPRLPADGEPRQLRAKGVPRIFFLGSRDTAVAEEVEALRRAALGWAVSVNFPTDRQGAALLADAAHRKQVINYISGFLIEQRALLQGQRTPRVSRSSPGLG